MFTSLCAHEGSLLQKNLLKNYFGTLYCRTLLIMEMVLWLPILVAHFPGSTSDPNLVVSQISITTSQNEIFVFLSLWNQDRWMYLVCAESTST